MRWNEPTFGCPKTETHEHEFGETYDAGVHVTRFHKAQRCKRCGAVRVSATEFKSNNG